MDAPRPRCLHHLACRDRPLDHAAAICGRQAIADSWATVLVERYPSIGLIPRQHRAEREFPKAFHRRSMFCCRGPRDRRSAGTGVNRHGLEDRTVSTIPMTELIRVPRLERPLPHAHVIIEDPPRRG